jgi:hypothetical protein
VKIQPGALEDDEEAISGSDSESAASGADDESKDSTDAEVEVEWDPAAEEEEEEEPANPNRCMYGALFTGYKCLSLTRVPDFVNRTKKTTPVKSLNFIWLVGFAGIMVCLLGRCHHRQG